MSAQPDRHLQPVEEERPLIVVNPATGEQVGTLDDHMQAMQDQIDGLETELRAGRTRLANLRRDKAREAREHNLFREAKALFEHWQQRCNHPRSKWTEDRFWVCLPYLKRDGIDLCKMAIDGLAWQPFKKEVGGYTEVFDDFESAFKKRATFERMCNRGARARKIWADEGRTS